tara:strand:+ start:8126 stop:8368 length:243 start_codon:yes stop_codon:yes gene_type:complete
MRGFSNIQTRLRRHYIDKFAIVWPAPNKLHCAIGCRKNCVVAPQTRVATRVNVRAALPDYDIPCLYLLTTIALDTQTFTL